MSEERNVCVQLEERIGFGNYAEVYRAILIDTDETVVVKIPIFSEKDASKIPDRIKELELTYKVFSSFQHLNIVRHLYHQHTLDRVSSETTDALIEMPKFQIIMEYCSGGNLSDYVARNNLSPPLLQRWISQLLNGLTYLHDKKIVHRDIKGANVFLSNTSPETCNLKIGDIGDVKQIKEERTGTNEVSGEHGTCRFMSPEMLRVEVANVGRRTDIWSLGCVIIQMITGNIPLFHRGDNLLSSEVSIHYFIMDGGSPTIPTDLPPVLDNFIRQCLTWEADKRPRSRDLHGDPLLSATNAAEWRLPRKS
ncbi:mitogen-activated protein kinase kinase kinase 4-like [Paramacrobiotus metropolitanus]|uniref:mitogen-activated protein kinase kinase kinase 4-like n=1 Tax=Paramacrobiotus metropolitanus TaxID=2943436 RepID=UPI002445C4B5|nr:mitogen-activated protein kinase kinase kinase 4-like [Paramacrobiotus metropolitanus]